jgi:glycosyltransferase involved in cell wall biosynthesis
VGDKKPWIVFVSRLIPGKGMDILLAGLPEILMRCPHLDVKIIGEGPLEEWVRNAVDKMPGSERVWVGFKREPISILKHSRIFLSLQDQENYPSQSLLEAMACGNAVIATDVGLTRRIVDEDVGVLIGRDSHQLTAAVCRLATDDALTKRLGEEARDRVLKEHSPSRYLRYLEDIYRQGTGLGGEV